MSIWKKKNVFVMCGLFFLIGTLCLAFLCINNSKNDTKLDKVNLKYENKVDKNMFAIMIQKEDGSGYEESNSFPSGMVLNETLSGCIDADGKAISGASEYNDVNNTIKLKSKGSTYCYLYFDLNTICDKNTPLGECIRSAKTAGFNSSMEGGLYRYQGTTNVNNYVCFGTTDKNECLSNTDAHMYRVIGVNSNNQVKLIKKEALYSVLGWYSSAPADDIPWPNSLLYSALQGTDFLENSTYVPTSWQSKIMTYSWKHGTFNAHLVDYVSPATADELYTKENAFYSTVSAKIGLIYAHDYAYAYQSGGLNCFQDGSYKVCKTSWMHLLNNDSEARSSSEWTMSRYGLFGGIYNSWFVYGDGFLANNHMHIAHCFRPVFYLTSSVNYVSGSGTASDPFIIDSVADTEAPTNNSVSINSGAASTSSAVVTLTLSSSGATEMCISNTSSCSSWEPYATSKSHTLTTGDGTKTVYVWFKDDSGNTSSYVTDSISLSTANSFGAYLRNTKTKGFNSTIEGGLYRYQGASGSVNNYVCFGTSTKSTCTGNTDRYMYRVIGVNTGGQVKIVKNEALNSVMQWYSSASSITWVNSTIYNNINGSSFYTNTTYVPTAWQDKIVTYSWAYGFNTNANTTASGLYSIEAAWTTLTGKKIGLMYAHDYAYAYQSGGLNCSSSGAYSTCKNSWMFLGNCDSGAPSTYDWLMSGYAYGSSWYISGNGYVSYTSNDATRSVRPVFYLASSVNYVSGSGTAADPFIIS